MKSSPKYTRHCETCGNSITLTKPDLMRGKGMFCSVQCRDYKKKVYNKICKNCHMPFKTTVFENIFCCDECAVEFIQ